jgi:hypothetical protein
MTDLATHPAITAYEEALNGLPECFDFLTASTIRDYVDAATRPDCTPADMAGSFIGEHFEMLATWHDAIDELDSELRSHVVEGSLSDDHMLYLKLQALGLFNATTTLQRAVCMYHHGAAGPGLSEDYGHAYPLSNSTLSPF